MSTVHRKCKERISSGSPPDIPPIKTLVDMNDIKDDGSIWIVLSKTSRNIDDRVTTRKPCSAKAI